MSTRKFIIFHTISVIILSIVLLLQSGILLYKFGLKDYELASNITMLIAGTYSGYITSNKMKTKKLLKSFLMTGIFYAIYMLLSIVLNQGVVQSIYVYLPVTLNLLFGTFIGIILSINKKPKRRGFSK